MRRTADPPIHVASVVTLATVATVVSVASVASAQDVGLPIGTVPPAAQVEDLDGTAVQLADFVGRRPVVLEFWATWCPVCEALEPALRRAHGRFGDRVEFLVIAVGVNQTPRAIRRHLERSPSPLPHVFDRQGQAVRAYRAPTTGYVVILDAEGRVAYTGVGGDQDLEAAVERVVEGRR